MKVDEIGNEGQSTIEFILTFTLSLMILFLFVKVSYIMVDGYIAHYATFIASRSYLVHDRGRADPAGSDGPAFSEAKILFKKYIKKGSKLRVNSPGDSGIKKIYVGLYYDYETNFTSTNLIGGKKDLKFRTESFLGREPTSSGCNKRICLAIELSGGQCGDYTTVFDNGC